MDTQEVVPVVVEQKRAPGRPKKGPSKKPLPREGISIKPVYDSNVMELKYETPVIFKKIFNLCKQMAVKNIKIEFDINFIKMKSSDHFNKNYNLLTINCSKLNHYYCKFPFSITVNSKNIETVFQKIDKNYDSITMASKEASLRESIYIIFNNRQVSSEECHIINLVENTEQAVEKSIDKLEYQKYPIKFELSSKFFKKIISDIASFNQDTHEQIFTIEKMENIPLQFKYYTAAKTIQAYTIFKDVDKIKLVSTIKDDDIFSVSIKIVNIKPLSNSPISDIITFYVDQYKDIVFKLDIDNGTFEFLIFTEIIKMY
jgi:hypothetical protein